MELTEMMDQLCKFKIGDLVSHRAAFKFKPEAEDGDIWEEETERFFVGGRFVEQCYGGIQAHYHVRPVSRRGAIATQFIRVTEVEIEAAEPFKPRKPRTPRWPMPTPDTKPTTSTPT